jgi:hypothetical protein
MPVLTGFLQTEYAINAIYPHRLHLSAKVRSFIDLLTKHFHEDPTWADPCRARLNAAQGNGADGTRPSLTVTADDIAPQQSAA